MSYRQIFIFVIFHDDDEWDRNLRILSTQNEGCWTISAQIMSWDKANTSQGFYSLFCICINCGSRITSNLVLLLYMSPSLLVTTYTSQSTLKDQSSLALLYNHHKNVSSHIFSWSQTFYFQTIIFTFFAHSGKQDLLLHPFLNFAQLIIIKNFTSFFWSLQNQQTWSVSYVPGTMVELSHKPSHLIL